MQLLSFLSYSDQDALRVLPDNVRTTLLSVMDGIASQPKGPDHGDLELLDDLELRLERRFAVKLPPLDRIVEAAWFESVSETATL